MAAKIKSTDPVFYVYLVFHPNGSPCYVGKGKGDRYLHHIKRASHNPRLRRIRAKYGDLPVVILHAGLTEAIALEYEVVLIAAIGRFDMKKGPLVNMTDGGDGIRAGGHSKETLARIGAPSKGRKASPEERAKLSAGQKIGWKDPDRRAALSMRNIGNKHFSGGKHSEETKAKISAGGQGIKKTVEARIKMSVAKKRYWAEKKGGGECQLSFIWA